MAIPDVDRTHWTTTQQAWSNSNVANQSMEKELPGWSEDITGVRHLDELPENARNYVRRIGELKVGISTFLKVGLPDRISNQYPHGKCLGLVYGQIREGQEIGWSKNDFLVPTSARHS